MREIPLTQGMSAVVDDEGFEFLNQYHWFFDSATGYARGAIKTDGVWKKTGMHQLILGTPPRGFEVDHINRNKLDNRRENLRFVTKKQNQANRKKCSTPCPSRYVGVCFEPSSSCTKKWRSSIWVNGKHRYLGHFRTEREAALAYNKAALEIRGEFANLNDL